MNCIILTFILLIYSFNAAKIIDNIEYIDQTEDYPTGCESISTIMCLHYWKINITHNLLFYTLSSISEVESKKRIFEKGKTLLDKILELIKLVFMDQFSLREDDIKDLKAGKYELNKEMTLKEIVDILKEGNNYSEDEISLTFKEGINMRRIAKIIASGTNNM